MNIIRERVYKYKQISSKVQPTLQEPKFQVLPSFGLFRLKKPPSIVDMSLEQTIGNLEIRYANVVTFVGSSNTMVDTTTGRIQTKGFQHNSNVITDVSGPHGRVAPTLKKYPEIAFESGKFDSNDSTNTYVQAGYTVSASRSQTAIVGENLIWEAFNGIASEIGMLLTGNNYDNDGNANTTGTTASRLSASDSTPHGEWLKLKLPNKIKLNKYVFTSRNDTTNWTQSAEAGQVWGSDNDSDWVHLHTFTSSGFTGASQTASFNVTTNNYYKYYAFIVTKTFAAGTNGYLCIPELEYYGYEEDPPAGDHSVDTTFKSRFNNPQLTGVQVLVDGATGVGTNHISGGPDPSGNQATMTSPNKYWTLNGTLTSNLSVEANTFLEGDQPHAVSVWFNSSNLEANVSNTCVFSIASEEKLDSVNLDLQSNTWHNLTYAYQGEGGSKVTYLDGRKVAEDQAEDTFGAYPPFDMTGYSQGGYVVSASSEYINGSDDRRSWKVFDGVRTAGSPPELWQTNGSTYTSTTPGVATGAGVQSFIANGVTFNGHWLKLKLPHKLLLNWLKVESGANDERRPWKGAILGSNDDVIWYTLKSFDGDTASTALTWYDGGSSIDVSDIVINSQLAYNYILFVIEETKVGTGHNCLVINQMHLYGHRENDLVRLPDPTNVLKYPHVAMTGPAQRGYVAKVSSQTSTTADYPHRIFDGDDTTQFRSALNTYTSGTANTTDNLKTQTSAGGTATINGSWVSIELPHKLILQSTRVVSNDGTSHVPERLIIYGSNDITNDGWTEVDTTYKSADANIPHAGTGKTWTTTASSTGYKNFALAVSQIESGTGNNRLVVSTWELYGTGVDSIPIKIGGGNIDKVANFRVYDKFIGEDQALEIWNAQKEEFGRAKPQMVLQQGKLGIGTDAPQGSLSVADEPHNLEEFPPRAMTANNTYFEGHGTFKASSSSEYSATYTAFDAFDKITYNDAGVADNAWLSANSSLYASASDYAFTGSTTLGNGTVAGEWLKLELPYKIVLKSITLSPRPSSTTHLNQAPEDFKIYGSNDDINWTEVLSETGAAPALWTGTDFITDTSSTTSYRYFAIVVQKTVGYANFTAISGLKYFGTREQGQSVLRDGQLTLTKSLNVPRIGPALDADDTPRRDRLVVEYNTSTNPTFEGAVRDTSGRGNDGVFYGGASYSANEKALVFDGDADYVESPPLGWSGAQPHSVSVWIKLDQMTNPNSTSIQNAWTIVHGGTTNRVSHLHIFTSGVIEWAFNGNNATTGTGQIQAGSWYHIVCVYNGGAGNATISRRMWINGQEKSWNSLGSSSTLNLEPEATFALGYNKQLNNYDHDGSVSNAKLYDTALTASEVKTLYDMGRTGSVANPQPLHISGPVNVMGDIRYITSHPLALPTMWDHMANGNCAKSVYPIVGTQGGSKVYNVYCEPDLAGGGWMCMAQISRNGYQVRSHPTDGDLDLFTKSIGDSKNIRWDNTFAVPINILSNNSGYDLDVMVYVSGGSLASRYEGGMRLGAVWRGANLAQAFNPGRVSGIVDRSGLATSSDGYGFTSRTPVTGGDYGIQTSGSWYYAIAGSSGQGAWNDYGYSDGGWILHQGDTSNHVGKLYGGLHKDDGTAENMYGSTNWVCARIFVRPSIY
jgi:hypothetical protein